MGDQADAVEKSIADDRFRPDASPADLAAVRGLAAEIDRDPTSPQMWGRYIECLRGLTSDIIEDEIAKLQAEIRDKAEAGTA